MAHFRRALVDERLAPDVYHIGTLARSNAFATAMRFVPAAARYACAYLLQR